MPSQVIEPKAGAFRADPIGSCPASLLDERFRRYSRSGSDGSGSGICSRDVITPVTFQKLLQHRRTTETPAISCFRSSNVHNFERRAGELEVQSWSLCRVDVLLIVWVGWLFSFRFVFFFFLRNNGIGLSCCPFRRAERQACHTACCVPS